MALYKGIIKSFSGSWGSGLGRIIIEDTETGKLINVPCENGPTVRAFEAAFGDVITPGHTARGDGYKGQEIYYELTDWGTLAGFTPVGEAPSELIEAYKKEVSNN